MTNSEKIYTSLCTLFTMLIVVGNLTYQKFVQLPLGSLYTFELSVGAILYPLTFLITDLIAEFYGKDRARFCVRFAITTNILVALIIHGMDILHATAWSKISDRIFHEVFGLYSIAFIGSIIACYVSQRLDIILYLRIRRMVKGKYLGLCNVCSSSLSLLMDTGIVIIFMTIFGILPVERMGALIGNSYAFKLFFTVCSGPLFYACCRGIKATQRS